MLRAKRRINDCKNPNSLWHFHRLMLEFSMAEGSKWVWGSYEGCCEPCEQMFLFKGYCISDRGNWVRYRKIKARNKDKNYVGAGLYLHSRRDLRRLFDPSWIELQAQNEDLVITCQYRSRWKIQSWQQCRIEWKLCTDFAGRSRFWEEIPRLLLATPLLIIVLDMNSFKKKKFFNELSSRRDKGMLKTRACFSAGQCRCGPEYLVVCQGNISFIFFASSLFSLLVGF